MQIAPPPPNEAERLSELHAYQILDSPNQEEYDKITRLAAELCGTPVSLITFIDQDRQWFKSHHGTDVQETIRDIAFCSHTILEPDNVLVIEDMSQDERFKGNPLVAGEPFVRFYAGVALQTPAGHKHGSLCVIDFEPRTLEANQVSALRVLAQHVVDLLELRSAKMRLKESVRELESQYAELREFSFITSHDLQEPLRTIRTYSDYLVENYGGQLDEIGNRSLDFIAGSASRMESLLKGIRDYKEVGLHGNTVAVDCNTMVEHVCMDYAKLIEELGATVRFEGLPTIHGSEFGIRVLFQNLICNALKFQSDGNEPEILITGEKTGNKAVLSVRDNGIGMDMKYATKVFDLFRRLHLQSAYKGNGIGLALCRRVVESYNGEIWIESNSEAGITVHFTMQDAPLS